MDLDRLREMLRRHEGVRDRPYVDTTGHITVGVGHNLSAKPLSRAAIDQILTDDISDVINDLDAHLPWWRGLDEVRQRVVADMAFNLGIYGLLTFAQTLTAIQEGYYEKAAALMLESRWAHQVGHRAVELSQMMASGRDQ